MKEKFNINLKELEEIIAEKFYSSHCILTGRATSGFTAIFKTLFKKNDHVIFPAILCPQPIMSAKSANLIPVIVDVEKKNGILDVDKVENTLKKNNKIKAIVFVELFGQQKGITLNKLKLLANQYKVILIRDCAQSLPIEKSDSDLTIMSFGHTKILECGHAGAVLTNNNEYYNLIREKVKHFKKYDKNTFYKNKTLYRKQYYLIKSKKLNVDDQRVAFNKLLLTQKNFYDFAFCKKYFDKIYYKFSKLDQIIEKRKKLSNLYLHNLKNKNIQIITDPNRDVPWRFSFLVPNKNVQKEITSKLWQHNFNASNWYESVMKYFNNKDLIIYEYPKNSYHFEERVLNLWIDDSTSIEYVNSCTTFLKKILDEERK